jgi:hypothetical protein
VSDGMILRHGVHKGMEDAANEMLRASMAGITKHSEKSDVLTPWKETSRRSREVYVESGTPDPSVRRGHFHRAWNSSAPHLNSVEGFAPPKISNKAESSVAPTVRWDDE